MLSGKGESFGSLVGALLEFCFVFGVWSPPFSVQPVVILSFLQIQPYCLKCAFFFPSETEYQPSAGSQLTQPDQNALNFENDSPLGIEPSDESEAVVMLKTELYTRQSLSN